MTQAQYYCYLPFFFIFTGKPVHGYMLLFCSFLLLSFRSLFLTARPLLRDWPIARHLCHTRRAEGKRRGTDGSSIGNDPQLREPSFVQARLCSMARNIVSLCISVFSFSLCSILPSIFHVLFVFPLLFFFFFAHIHDNFLFSSLPQFLSHYYFSSSLFHSFFSRFTTIRMIVRSVNN